MKFFLHDLLIFWFLHESARENVKFEQSHPKLETSSHMKIHEAIEDMDREEFNDPLLENLIHTRY